MKVMKIKSVRFKEEVQAAVDAANELNTSVADVEEPSVCQMLAASQYIKKLKELAALIGEFKQLFESDAKEFERICEDIQKQEKGWADKFKVKLPF